MVYDEGFEINLGKKDTSEFSSYFTFLKFSRNNNTKQSILSKHFSHCYEALIGWFHTDNKKWGCFYGHKLGVNYKEPTNGEADDKLLVVENVIKPAFIEKEVQVEIKNQEKNFLKNFDAGRFMQTEFNNKFENKLNNKLTVKTRNLLSLDSEFTNHEEVVDRINSMNLGWKAEVYSEFKGKTIADINKFSGRAGKVEIMEKGQEMKNKKIKNNLSENKSTTSKFLIFYIKLLNFL